jgi:hypothetical protein
MEVGFESRRRTDGGNRDGEGRRRKPIQVRGICQRKQMGRDCSGFRGGRDCSAQGE